nr:hypothetical protein [Tanacetum cinerariifolium]
MADVNAPSGQAPEIAPPLDEQWVVLTKDTLREALQITPVNNNQAFAAPLTSEELVNFINELGYPKLVRNLSNVVTNDLFQPWRTLLTIINLCLMGKTSGFERPRAPVLQILWGIIKQANIDFAERICEEFVQSIHTFIEDKRNLSQHITRKKRATLIVIPSIRAKGTKREVFRMPIPGSFITVEIQHASYYWEYLAKVAQHRRYLAGETVGVQDPSVPKPTQPAMKPKSKITKAPPRPAVTSTQPAPTSTLAEPQAKKRKQATETSDKPPKAKKSKYGWVSKKRTLKNVDASKAEEVPAVEPQVAAEDTDLQKALEESMKTVYALPRALLPPVVIREPEFRKYQPLPEVQGKGKAKVTEEKVAHDLLSLQKHKKTSLANQYIFQRHVSEPTGSSGYDESLYNLLRQSDSEEESEKVMLGANKEGQAGSNPDEMSEGQARPDHGNAEDEEQSIPSHVVHAGSDREHMDL